MSTLADKAEELTATQTNAAGKWLADKAGLGNDPGAVADAQAVVAHAVGFAAAMLVVYAAKLLPASKAGSKAEF